MVSVPGHIELERSLDSIQVGHRHRDDLGDIDQLAESIERDGLLQPVTITPDGVLVCGQRRLAAMRKLGWKTANVWVRSGITDRLGELLAEQDDNALHKPLTLTEQAALYRELKQVMAEDAARRQKASRFAVGNANPRSDGGATVAPPSEGTSEGAGKSRAQAARIVSGRNSYTSFERINELQHLAQDESQPSSVRERAARELDGIDQGASITAAHQRTHAEVSLAELDRLASSPEASTEVRAQAAADAEQLRAAEAQTRAAELERLAADALARLDAEQKAKRKGKKGKLYLAPVPVTSAVMTVRAFVLTWEDLADWWERADPDTIGRELTAEQWEQFTRTVAGTVEFMETAARSRAEPDDAEAQPAAGRRLHAI